jgi:hypothetical protein
MLGFYRYLIGEHGTLFTVPLISIRIAMACCHYLLQKLASFIEFLLFSVTESKHLTLTAEIKFDFM